MPNRTLITDEGLRNVADAMDHLINIDVGARGTIGVLFEAARAKAPDDLPMTLAAVQLLDRSVKTGDYVFITTGWADQPSNIATKSETDGPPGAGAMARTIRLALGGLPVILTDDYLVEDMKQVMTATGCHVVEPDHLSASLSSELGFKCVPTIAVLGMPIDATTCKARAAQLLQKYHPAICIAIERGAMNRHGRIHGMGGFDFSDNMAKMDYLFMQGASMGIPSIGIGDGGNEIGMANIEKTIREKVRNGNLCKCPCHSGIAPDMAQVNVLLSSAISNWGAYAISCLLALAKGDLESMHTEDIEQRVLETCARVEFHDSIGSRVAPSVDGCEAPIHMAIIRLLRKAVEMGIARFPINP